jgi:outer membrane protein TolC
MRSGVEVLQRELDLEETTRRVRSEVLVQVTRLEAAQRKVDLADFQVRLAQETLDAEEALNEAGRAIQKDVLEARQERDRLTSEAAKARTDWRIAQVDLLRLQGQLSGTDGMF